MERQNDLLDSETLLFFDQQPQALPLYECFVQRLMEQFPQAQKKVQKTQITFSHRHVFACVSFQRVKRKALLPDPYLVLTLGLSYPLASERVALKVEPYPGRWTTHIVIGSREEIDEELFTWVGQAYSFSEGK